MHNSVLIHFYTCKSLDGTVKTSIVFNFNTIRPLNCRNDVTRCVGPRFDRQASWISFVWCKFVITPKFGRIFSLAINCSIKPGCDAMTKKTFTIEIISGKFYQNFIRRGRLIRSSSSLRSRVVNASDCKVVVWHNDTVWKLQAGKLPPSASKIPFRRVYWGAEEPNEPSKSSSV